MTTTITEDPTNASATATGEPVRPKKKARVAKRAGHVAPTKAKSARKHTPAKKAHKTANGGKPAKQAASARQGSKTAKVLDLLKRRDGASLKELMRATGWQAHSVRGFLSVTVGKKMGLAVTSTKSEEGERSYSIKG